MSDRNSVVVVGAGQAGLAVSRELTEAGVSHIVLERGRVGQTWRGRWDSFCLVTPNWSMQLRGQPYDGKYPDGFDPRDEIVAFLERYAAAFEAPVREGVEVTSLEPRPAGGFLLETSDGPLEAMTVVLSTGAYQRPHRPRGAATLPADLLQIDVEDYRNPADLPGGPVLVVGSGQTGCQIAEELHQPGREVFLACGRAPWAPRRIGDRDLVWWLLDTGFLDAPVSSLPDPTARLGANVLSTGHDGAMTSTFGRFGEWASPCSVTSWAPKAATRDSRLISARAWRGPIRRTRSSWTWWPNVGTPSPTSPSRSRSTRKRPST